MDDVLARQRPEKPAAGGASLMSEGQNETNNQELSGECDEHIACLFERLHGPYST